MTKIEKLCIKWLNDNYNHMEPFLMKEYPDYIFHMKNGKCILQYNKKNGYVYVSYSEIWKFFENMFSMSNQQIKDITKIWVEEHYKVGVTTSFILNSYQNELVDEHYKVQVTTTPIVSLFLIESGWSKTTPIENHRVCKEIEEQYKEILTTNNQLNFYSEKDVEELYESHIQI